MFNKIKMEQLVREMLIELGENPDRDGLVDTPKRVAKMYLNELGTGYQNKDEKIQDLFKAVFHEDHHEMVIVRDIDFSSLCEHHMVPYIGKIHIGYIPNGTVLGISKFARLVDVLSKRLTIQENLTSELADLIEEYLKPLGVIVVAEAQHMCMVIRGVKKQNAFTTTSAIRGVFKDNAAARLEFLNLIGRK